MRQPTAGQSHFDRRTLQDRHGAYLRVERRYGLTKVLLLLAVFLRTSSKERILQPSTPSNRQAQGEVYCRDDRGLYKYSKLSRQASSLLYTQLQLYTTGHITDRQDEQRSAHIQYIIASFHSCCVSFLRFVWTKTQMVHFSRARKYA